MEAPILRQIAQLLQDRRERKRRMIVFLCLAVAVGFGTVAALRLIGQAMTHKERVLVCSLNLHEHTSECYDADGKVICGYADYVVHEHNDDCYDKDGNLVCTLPEIEEHEHTDECYEEQKVLVCGQEESAAGHQHTESCYTRQQGELKCQLPEHQHTEGCYDETGAVVCGMQEHQHTEECYEWNNVLTCQEPEGSHTHTDECYTRQQGELKCQLPEHQHTEGCYDETGAVICGMQEHQHTEECYEWNNVLTCQKAEGGHTHTDECYKTEKVKICEKPEVKLHVHTDECYEKIDGEEGDSANTEAGEEAENAKENRRLICGQLQVEKHVHAEEFNCFKFIEADNKEEAENQGEPEAGDKEDELFTTDLNEEDGQTTDGTEENDGTDESEDGSEELDGDKASDESEEPEDGEKTEEESGHVKSYTGDGYKVTAVYDDKAEIPEEAELIAEQITAESDKAHYEEREAEYRKSTGDKNATMKGLFKIGFYVNGEEIEPKSAVKLTIQFIDENGLPEGAPITVVHFADEGAEVLNGSEAQKGSTTFNIGSFSEIAIGYGADVKTSVHISESYEYSDEAFHITFHVEGTADLKDETAGKSADGTGAQGEMISLPSQGGNGKAERQSREEGKEEDNKSAQSERPEAETAEGQAQSDRQGTEAVDQQVQSGQPEAGNADQSAQSDQPEAGSTDQADQPAQEENQEETSPVSDQEAAVAAIEAGAMNAPESTDREKLEFKLQRLDKNSEEYQAVVDDAAKADDGSELLFVQTMAYAMYYDGVELDLSRCKVTATVEAAQPLSEKIEESVPEAMDYLRAAEGEPLTGSAESTEPTGEAQSTESTEPAESAEEAQPTEVSIEVVSIENAATVAMIDSKILSQDNPNDTMVFAAPQMFAARATGQPNPKFTVQYYANLDVVAYNDDSLKVTIDSKNNTNELPIIDTSERKLPQNGKGKTASPNDNSIRNLYVDTTTGKLKTKAELKEVYESRPFEYYKAPTINYINALTANPSYTLKEVWVLNEGKSADSTNRADWTIYEYNADLHFTNRSVSAESGEYVLISDGATLRLVYDTTTNDKEFEAAFYDYDIGDGKIYDSQSDAQKRQKGKNTSEQGNGTNYMHTKQSGINSPGNYTGSGSKLAFGNANTGSGLQHEQWSGNLLNKFNGTQDGHPTVSGSYKGCAFGLVTGLVNGKIQYAPGVSAPNLFNDGSAAGKTSYDQKQYSLMFNRVGDTHTLTSVKKGTEGSATGSLDTFNHPSPNNSTVHNHIWTNNFWPMDKAPSFGTDGHDMKFGDYVNREKYKFAGQAGSAGGYAAANGTFPWSDDGMDHNSYFGMHYKVEFELGADYVGPLEYYFFGDDDMWVFLDNQLICDIGGVHSSVGEYVNLWDYIDKESEKIHRHGDECYDKDNNLICGYTDTKKFTLNFFYTERGESGSTCWMQFTLPSASSITPETTDEDYGHLRVEKTVTQINDEVSETVNNGDEFEFTLRLTDKDGNNLPDDYSYVKYDRNGKEIGHDLIIWDGGEFTLKGGEYVIVQYLPEGTKYEIVEANRALIITDNTSQYSETEYFTDITIDGNPALIKPHTHNESCYNEDGELTCAFKNEPHQHGEECPKDKDGNYTCGYVEAKDLKDDNKAALGDISSNNTSLVQYNNKFYAYSLPKTGGSGLIIYTIAGVLCIGTGAGFMYRKKFRERRVKVSSGN